MPRSWTDVEQSPEFQALPLGDRKAARDQYFLDVVVPKIPAGVAPEDVWKNYYTDTTSALPPESGYGDIIAKGIENTPEQATAAGAGVLRAAIAAGKPENAALSYLTHQADQQAIDQNITKLENEPYTGASDLALRGADIAGNYIKKLGSRVGGALDQATFMGTVVPSTIARTVFDNPEESLRKVQEEGVQQAAENAPVVDYPLSAKGIVDVTAQSLPQMLPGMAGAYITKNPELALVPGMGIAAGQSYGEQIKGGSDPYTAAHVALIQGVAERIGEKLPLDELLKENVGGFVKKVSKTAAKGAIGEDVTQAMQDLSDYATINPNMTLGDFVQNQAIAGAAGGVSEGAMAVPIAGFESMTGHNTAPPPPAEPPPAAAAPQEPLPPDLKPPPRAAAPQPTPDIIKSELDQVLNSDKPISDIIDQTDFPDKLPHEQVIMVDEGEGTDAQGFAYLDPTTGNVRYPSEPPAFNATDTLQPVPQGAILEPGTQVQTDENGQQLARVASPKKPIIATTPEDLAVAAEGAASHPANNLPEPTDAQKEAGNYKKGHVNIQGVNISIETPRGGERSGDTPDGGKWSVKMPVDYGYIKRTTGADNEQVDVFLGNNPKADKVFVINQLDADTGKFDEHKVMMGFDNLKDATEAYRQSFSDGRGLERIGGAEQLTMDGFKDWLKNSNTKKPIGKGIPTREQRMAFIERYGGHEAPASLNRLAEQEIAARAAAAPKPQMFEDIAAKIANMKVPQLERRLASLNKKITEGLAPTSAEHYERETIAAKLRETPDGATPAAEELPAEPTIAPGLARSMALTDKAITDKNVEFLDNALGNLGNKNIRAHFEKQTGVTLPKTVGGTRTAIREWAGQPAEENKGYTVTKADIIPTRAGVIAVPHAPENAENVQKPAENVQEPPSHGQKTEENAHVEAMRSLNEHFQRKLEAGGEYPSIQQVRRDAGNILGAPVQPNTQEAKQVDEQMEIAVTNLARKIVSEGKGDIKAIYDRLVRLYKQQPILAQRSSTSVEEQAYSTPAPVAYVASRLAHVTQDDAVLEPTAGNGSLLIEANPANTKAVELNDERAAALERMFPNMTVIKQDFLRLPGNQKQFDVVLANPPFGNIPDGGLYKVGGRETKELDQAIALKALSYMKDDGRATLIIGSKAGLNKSEKGVAAAYNSDNARLFFKHLYDNYNVVQHVTLSGDLYKKQGAGYPIDVIVINGRGKSSLDLPGYKPPRLYSSFGELKGLLDDGNLERVANAKGQQVSSPADREIAATANNESAVPERGNGAPPAADIAAGTGRSAGNDRILVVRPGAAESTEQPGSVGRSDNAPATGGRNLEPDTGARGSQPAGESGVSTRPDAGRSTGEPAGAANPKSERRIVKAEVVSESGHQVSYQPTSKGKTLDTLVPVKMKAAIDRAIATIEDDVGDIDAYVSDQLGYDSPEELYKHFGAEQIEAVALAIRNIEKGAGFIIGDQTGIGKGRVNAAILRYGRLKGQVPLFVTKQPGLYADMYRDLAAIGEKNFKAFITNSDISGDQAIYVEETGDTIKSLTPAAYKKALEQITQTGKLPDGYDYLFTTYSQLQPVAGKGTARHAALEAVAPNAIITFDESHEAGGQAKGAFKVKKKLKEGEVAPPEHYESRAKFTRHIVNQADGVMYSSATFAKSPDVMDLYSKTDIKLGVDKIEDLAPTITKGGVPLQQVMANMLVDAGQMVRREKSFDGVGMELVELPADHAQADMISSALRRIFNFDTKLAEVRKALKEEFKKEAGAMGKDNAIGEAGLNSTNFSSIMHNVVAQALVAAKIKQVAERAIALHKQGIKPLIAVSNTNESFLRDYMEGNNLQVGDDASGLTFNRLFERYLARTRYMTKKDSEGNKTRREITDHEIKSLGGDALLDEYHNLMDELGKDDYGAAPVSPIDYLRYELAKAGIKVGELTGREYILDYKDGGKVVIAQRKSSDAQKKRDMNAFNNGGIDAIMLNRSGSTGFSMHAAKEFKDQKPRKMIILQAEPDINVYMQMLGRIHRTGQVVLPSYDITISNIPVERRPAAVLMKKLASLNANTTANKRGATTLDNVVDFMNHYGDVVTSDLLRDEPGLRKQIDVELPTDEERIDGLAAKVTGRLAILPVKEQGRILDMIENRYKQLIAYLDSIGENALEAKELDLQAETKGITEVEPSSGTSPFQDAVRLEQVSAKRIGKPYTMEMIKEKTRDLLDGRTAKEYSAALKKEYMDDTADEWRRYEQRAKAASGEREEKAEKERRRFQDATALRKLILESLDDFNVGDIVTLKGDDGNLHGIILDVERDKSSSPVALSQFSIRIALADASREITVPLSQVTQRPGEEKKPKYELTSSYMSREEIENLFEVGQRDVRQTRYIVTGNLFKGYAKFQQGKIIFYTKNDGTKAQGILMAPTFQPAEELKKLSVKLNNADEAGKLLAEFKDAQVITLDDMVTVSRDDIHGKGEYRIDVTRRGKKYYTSDAVRKAVGGDLYSRAGDFRATFPPEKLGAVFAAVQEEGGNWAVKKNQDFIRNLRGEGSILKFQTTKAGTGDERARIVIKKEWTEAEKKIASGIKQLARERFGDSLKLEFADRITNAAGAESFGAFDPRPREGRNGALEYMAYVSLSPENGNPFGALNHEGIHYLRQAGMIDDHTWSVLTERALGKGGFIEKYGIKGMYPQADIALQIEEGIAEAFADKASWNKLPQTARVIFNKIYDFLDAVKKFLTGQGFGNVNKIFRDISAGAMTKNRASNVEEKTDMLHQVAREKEYPVAGETVSGLKVRDQVPNMSSIASSLTDYDVLAGIREIPFTAFPSMGELTYHSVSEKTRTKQLAEQIKESKEINPLIVVEDAEGLYVLEGAHRFDALRELGIKSFPAKVVVDNDATAASHPVATTVEAARMQAARAKTKAAPMTLSTSDEGIADIVTDGNRTLVQKLKALGKGQSYRASLDHFRRYMQDRFLHFYRVQKKIEELTGQKLGESMDVYGAEEMFTGRAGEKLLQLELKHKEPIIKRIADFNNTHGDGLEKVEKFIYALHAPERNAQIAKVNPKFPDGGSGMTNDEAQAIIDDAKKAGTFDELTAISKMIHTMLEQSLKSRVEMGLISQKFYDTLTGTYKNYVPLRGVKEIGAEEFGLKTGKGMDTRGKEFQRARGRGSLAPDILANTFAIADESIIRGEKNRVGQALYKLVTTYPAPDMWEVAKPKLMPILNAATGLIEYRPLPMPKNMKLNDNTIGVKVDGVQKLITLKDKRLATPIKNLEMDEAHALVRFLMVYNGFLSRMYTTFDPEFIIKNAFRDIQTAVVNMAEFDKKGLIKNTMRDYGKALKASFGGVRGKDETEWQKYFREYAAAGGKVTFFQLDDLKARRTKLEKEIKGREGGLWNMTKHGAGQLVDFIELSNQGIENGIRLSAFVNARRLGMSDQEAARLAKNLTVNFNKRGEYAPKVNAMYLFFNASIQGIFRIFSALKSKNVQKIVAAIIAMGFAEEMMNAMLSPPDDDGESLYDKIPQYVKESNIVIVDPTGMLTKIVNGILPTGQIKGVHYIKIPMAYGYRVFHELGRTTAAYARGKNTLTQSMGEMAYSVMNNFNPVGGQQTFLNLVAPTILDPIVDLYNNKNFAGNRIYPEVSQFDKSPPPASERYFPNVSDFSRLSAQWLNEVTGGDKITPGAVSVSPEIIDYFFSQFTGSAGAFVGRTVDAVKKGFTGEDIAIGDVPFVRQMFGAQQPWFDKNTAYDRMHDIENIDGRMDSYMKAGDQKKAAKLRDDNRAVLLLEPAVKFTEKALSDLRKKKIFFELHKSYTDEQKAGHIKQIDEREREVVNAFNHKYLAAVKADKERQQGGSHAE